MQSPRTQNSYQESSGDPIKIYLIQTQTTVQNTKHTTLSHQTSKEEHAQKNERRRIIHLHVKAPKGESPRERRNLRKWVFIVMRWFTSIIHFFDENTSKKEEKDKQQRHTLRENKRERDSGYLVQESQAFLNKLEFVGA